MTLKAVAGSMASTAGLASSAPNQSSQGLPAAEPPRVMMAGAPSDRSRRADWLASEKTRRGWASSSMAFSVSSVTLGASGTGVMPARTAARKAAAYSTPGSPSRATRSHTDNPSR